MAKALALRHVGTDAEMFLRNKDTNEIISAEGYIKGSKRRPFKWDKKNPWFSTQLDNVLAEITIPPAATASAFEKGIHRAIDYIAKTLPANIEPVIQASANLDEKYLMTEQAQMFGCDPDYNAYSRNMNFKPWCEDPTLRSCGAHVHLGYDGVEVKFKNDIFNYEVDAQRADIVQCLDLHLSIPLVIMEPDSDRKLLYGKAGAFRPKPYGLEYRTPSNWYLSRNDLIKWVFNNTKAAFNRYVKQGALEAGLARYVEETINTNNKSAANDLVNEFKLQLA